MVFHQGGQRRLAFRGCSIWCEYDDRHLLL